MSNLIRREDAVNEIHKYFVAEIEKTPTVIDEDGDELYADMTTVNSLLACNKELSKRIKALPSAEAVEVIRCRECLMTKERDEYTGRVWCCRHRELMDDMYYCADGLRREDGET